MNPSIVCPHCKTEIGAALKTCPGCGWLVHSERLKGLSDSARRAVSEDRLTDALIEWREALELLPAESRQHDVIRAEVSRLSEQIAATPTARLRSASASPQPTGKPASSRKPANFIGAAAAALIVLLKFKTVILLALGKGKLLLLGVGKWSTLWTMLLSLGVYWTAWGWKFALGLIVALYIHEMGHVFAMQRYGLKVSAPLFIPGVGAFVELKQHPVNPIEDARIGIAGPVWGLGCAVLSYGMYWGTGSKFWSGLTHFLAWITVFNLTPLWQLDGSRAFRAFGVAARWGVVAIVGALWLWSREGLLILVGLVAFLRLNAGDHPGQTDRPAWLQYALVIALSTALAKLSPAH